MKYVFRFYPEKCVACGACSVACMDQNDINTAAGELPFRRVEIREPADGVGKISYHSIGCLHCDDAPCAAVCPMGCLTKNKLGMVVCDNTACIGCRACQSVCPVGAPTFRTDRRMYKCDGCTTRLECGLSPACVRVCPTGALVCVPED